MTTDIPALEDWQKPLPFSPENAHRVNPYPVECLPSPIKNAVVSYQQYGQQPISMVACSALSAVSLACQTLANIARDSLLVSPVSLYFIVIAASGERKTAADHTFSRAIKQWELKVRENLMPEVQVSQTLYYAWLAEKKGILAKIRHTSFMEYEAIAELKQGLVALERNEPQVPLLPMLFFEDTTQEALVSHLAEGWPSASLWSDEGGIVMAGHGMQGNTTKFVALLNRLWDGKPFTTHRKTSKNFEVSNRRLTLSLMLQPLIMEQLLFKSGGISRQSGFLARSLMAFPESAMGERFYQEPPDTLTSLPCFQQRLTDCLDASLSLNHLGCHEIPTLSFSPLAKVRWVDFFNNIETGLKKSHHWSGIKDFASKAAENAARLSALFHLFEGKEGEIGTEPVEQATEIIQWHLLEARRILETQPKASSQTQDAAKLLRWLCKKGLPSTTLRHLQQYSPLRDKSKIELALQTLIENYHLKPIQFDGKTLFLINPHLFKS